MSATQPEAPSTAVSSTAGTSDASHIYPAKTKKTPLAILWNLIRGAFIGMAELVPGISGGTVALVLGLYERALHNGEQLISLLKVAIKDRSQMKAALAKIDWWFLIAVAIGMVTAVFTLSSVLSTFVEDHPEVSRGLFLGMVAVSILVPIGMMDGRDAKKRLPLLIPLALVCAVISFFGTGFTSAPQEDPSLIIIFIAAAIAVCALVLPGVSGSFFLLALGLYAPIMSALSNREWDVIGVFMIGAITGIALFIKILSYILENHRTITLTVMAGLMLGSLRALWPWQDSEATLLAPTGVIWPIILAIVIGAVVVAAVMITDRLITAKNLDSAVISESDPV